MNGKRRGFLMQVGGAVASTALGRAQSAYRTPAGWFERPMRWAQLVFTEDDPGRYDPKFWLDYFERVHADGACLAGGGYMAFYPTKIPLHRRSKYLGDSDPFGELVAGCRKLGMAVIARTDPHAAHEAMAKAHPDWIAVDAEGKPRRHWANPELWVTCALGPMNFEFMTQVNNEIVSTYGVDGIFSNRWAGHGPCYCEHCRKNFKAFSGYDLPRTASPRDPARRDYIVWHEKRLFEVWKLWDSEIRKVNANARFIPNSGGGALSELDMRQVGEWADILFADRQARRGVMAPWANGKNGKEYRAALGKKPIGGIFSVGVEEPYRWKDSVQGAAELKLWAMDGIAHGLRPWFAKFNGKPYDKRWLAPVEEVYRWHHANERYLKNTENLARVAVVFSQQTAKFYGGGQARALVEEPIDGWYQALVEARVPFEMVHDRTLDGAGRFQTLILPNVAALSTAQCVQLREFVKNGGSLIATHETSLYDEWGERRANFGLSDVFGAKFGGRIERRMQNAYLELHGPHPLLKGLEDAPRIIHGVNRVHTIALDSGAGVAPLTLIPSYPDLPMEDVYPQVKPPGTPEVYVREVGKGRVVYFPWDIDRTFWDVLAVDHLRLMRNAVDWAMRGERVVEVTGPGVVDIAVWRQRDSLTVHVVNLTNAMMMKGPVRDIVPLAGQRVRLTLPKGTKAKGVRLLVSGERVQAQTRGEGIDVPLPPVGIHEVVAVDLG
ncbi:MAG: beta-galactosidase trimerization domain-containing protein [Bryobacterales bacterium]|nr:beta-galactosidase trimerization domain-containing protein [Bryobacterales bacterium]